MFAGTAGEEEGDDDKGTSFEDLRPLSTSTCAGRDGGYWNAVVL